MRMMRSGAAILAAGWLVAGCVSEPVLTPSELNANPGVYDGKQVRVHAWLVYQFENIGLWDSQAAYEGGSRAACVSYVGPDRAKFSGMVTLTGKFNKDLYYDPDPNVVIVSNGYCNKTGVMVDR